MNQAQELIAALFGLFLMLAFIWMFIAGFFRSPFVPSNRKTVERMLEVAKIRKDERVVDLGCGDGRIVVRADKEYGARAEGYEISIIVWLLAKLNCWLSGSKAKIYRRNFFRADLTHTDIVFCYLLPEVMAKLAPKFEKELKPGARIISAAFSLPSWKVVKEYPRKDGVVKILVYKKG